jgi:hypothetical protein
MSRLVCKGCGGSTNSTTCDYMSHKDHLPRKCYVKWVDDKAVKGCGYDDFKAATLKNPNKYSMFNLKFYSDILKTMRCDKCENWIPDDYNNKYFSPADFQGECTGLKGSDMIDFTIRSGWDGGYLSEIETRCDFFCACFKKKE